MQNKANGILARLLGRRGHKRPRRRWRLLRRALLLPSAILLIAYLTLPWWLPTDWLHGQIVRQLQSDLGRPVSLGNVEVSWARGIVLNNLRVRQAEPFGGGDLLHVEQASCPFRPIRMALTGQIDRVELYNCRVEVVRNEAGQVNTAELRMPTSTMKLKILRVSCQSTDVVLVNRKSRQTATLRLGAVDCRLDPATGWIRAAMTGRGAYENQSGPHDVGNFSVSANVLDPFTGNAPAGPQQGGQLHLTWRTVDLASLVLGDWDVAGKIGLLNLAGQCGGTLDVELTAEGRINWQFSSDFQQLEMQLAHLPSGVRVPAGRLELEGYFDLTSHHSAIDRLRVELPGLDLAARVELRPDYHSYFGITLEHARVQPAVLRQVAPDLLAWIDPTVRLDGELSLAGKIEWENALLPRRVDLALDATPLALSADGAIDKPAGVPALAAVRASYQQNIDRLDVENVALQLGGSRFALQATADELYPVYTGARSVWDVWLDWMVTLAVHSPDADELLDRLPALRNSLGRTQWAGPANAEIRFRPIVRGRGEHRNVQARLLTGQLRLASTARLTVPDPAGGPPLLDKPPGQPLALEIDGRLDPDSPTLESGTLVFRRGSDGEPDAASLALSPLTGKLAFNHRPTGDGGRSIDKDAVLDARIDGRNVGRLIELSPHLVDRLAADRTRIDGDLAGEVNFRLGREQMRARLALQLDGLACQVGGSAGALDLFGLQLAIPAGPAAMVKKRGQPARVELNYQTYPTLSDDALPAQFEQRRFDCDGLGLAASVRVSRIWQADRPPVEQTDVELTLRDLAELQSHSPLLARQLRNAGWELAGAADAELHWLAGEQHLFDIRLDATGLAATGAAMASGHKPAGLPLRVATRVATNLPDAPAQPRFEVLDASVVVGPSQMTLSGELLLLPVWWDIDQQPAGHLGELIARPPPIDRLDFRLDGRLVCDERLQALWPALAATLARANVRGQADLKAHVSGGWDRLQLVADLDAERLNFEWPGCLRKPAGVAARAAVDVGISPRLEVWTVRKVDARLDELSLSATGQVRRRIGSLAPADYNLRLDVEAADLGRLAELCPVVLSQPDLLTGPISGRLRGRLHLFADSIALPGEIAPPTPTRPRVLASEVELDQVACTLAGMPVVATGRAEFSDRELFIPSLLLTAGDSKAAVAARVNDPANRPAGWVQINGETLDVDQVSAWWGRLAHLPGSGVAAPAAGEAPAGPAGGNQAARRIIDFAAACDLSGEIHLGDVLLTDPKNQSRYTLREFTSRLSVDGGKVAAPFRTAMEGGTLTGRADCDLSAEQPMLATAFEAYRLLPTAYVQPQVEALFPGIAIHGYVTMTERNERQLLPLPGQSNWTVGSGEVIFEKGTLTSQASPDWMVKVFPGLKLTQYRFDRMHDWYSLTADGRANHHMIFEGARYNLYMIGYTHRGSGEARYTVGVDLLAGLDSKRWSVDLRQGKIPLMYVSGRIENRQLKDARYTMVPPPVALWQILFRDNILYRGVIEKAVRSKAD